MLYHCTCKYKRRSITLLEVMIALSLAVILLSALMTSYYQISKKRMTAQELKKSSLSVEMMRQRLTHLFAQAVAAESLRFQTGAHPEAIGPGLIFTFHNGVDLNPAFCGDVTGMLYQNADHKLCLASWASNGEARVEMLLDNIREVSFSFFDSSRKTWKPTWEKSSPFPPFFKLSWSTMDRPKEVQKCAFFFSQNTPITYETQVLMP